MKDIKTLTIKEIRAKSGLSQKEFADKYKLPLGTLRNWEQGLRTPPSYVVYYLYLLVFKKK